MAWTLSRLLAVIDPEWSQSAPVLIVGLEGEARPPDGSSNLVSLVEKIDILSPRYSIRTQHAPGPHHPLQNNKAAVKAFCSFYGEYS